MRRAGGLDKAHRPEGGLVLEEFHARLQFQRRKAQRSGARFGMLDQLPRQPPSAMCRRDGQLAQIQHPWLGCHEHASQGWTEYPDLADFGLPRQSPGRELSQG